MRCDQAPLHHGIKADMTAQSFGHKTSTQQGFVIDTFQHILLAIIMEASTSASSSTPATVPLAPSKQGRAPGKAHKSAKQAKARSYISASIKTPFEKRKELEKQRDATKGVERDMKDEAAAERERYVLRVIWLSL